MNEFNCGNCRHRIEVYDKEHGLFIEKNLCGKDEDRTLEVDWEDYCSFHMHQNVYDKALHEKYTRANNTLLGY